MDNYKIVVTPQSYRDLDDVYSVVLRLSADKDTAHNYIETIKAAIRKLKTRLQIQPVIGLYFFA